MSTLDAEFLIVGAGPAGATLAAALAERGREVVALDRDTFPRNKVCGEFLSPEVEDCLRRLGCLERFHELSPSTMTRARLTSASGRTLHLDLPATAYGLTRRSLDAFLVDEARHRGAVVREGVDVRSLEKVNGGVRATWPGGQLRASRVILAHGRRSRLDRRLNRPYFSRRSPYVAFKQHFRLRDDASDALPSLRHTVELHIFEGGYCGVSFAEDQIVNVCTMLHEDLVKGREIWDVLGRGAAPLAHRLRSLRPVDDELLAIAQIPLALKERGRDGLLFVGDAASMIAPLAGDGQAMAIESALSLASLLLSSRDDDLESLWRRRWRRRYEARIRLGRLLQEAMIRPAVTEPALIALNHMPRVTDALVRLTRG